MDDTISIDPIVFIHGFLGTPYDFKPIIKLLEKDFQCISIDLNQASSFSLSNQALYINQVLRELKISRGHFWGYSMGGRVLLEFYKEFPKIPISLTLESTSLGIVSKDERIERLKQDKAWGLAIQKDKVRFLKKWYDQPLFESIRNHCSFDRYFVRKKNEISDHHSQMVIEASPGANPHYYDQIYDLGIPCLALVGQRDQKYSQMWAKMIDKNSNLVIRTVEDSGHVIHLENPQQATDLFKRFVEKVPAALLP